MAAVLQGRYITHQALRALGATERITAVTSFRPKSSFVRDDTVLTTTRPISDLSALYFEFSEYRFDMLIDRFQAQLRKLRADDRAGKKMDLAKLRKFITEQAEFLERMNKEMVDYDSVVKGILPHEDMPEDMPKETVERSESPKRARLN